MNKQISIRLDIEVLDRVERVAASQGNRSAASIIRECLYREFQPVKATAPEAVSNAGK